MAADIEVAAVRLPGRDGRLRERPFRRWAALLDALIPALSVELTRPFVFFGHSMGAMIAYELTGRLAAVGCQPQRLVLAACRSPHTPNTLRTIHDLPEAEFIASLKSIGATPEQLFTDHRLLQLLAPMLRADLELAETWPPSPAQPVKVPLVVMAGDEDPIAPPAAVEGWAGYSEAGFRSHTLRGGHFFMRSGRTAFFDLLRTELATAAS